jgi:hypothetical protein
MNAFAYKHECENPWGLDKPQRRRREPAFRPVVVELKIGSTEQFGSVASKIANKYGFVSNHLKIWEWPNIWPESKSQLAFYGGGEARPIANQCCNLDQQSTPLADWIPHYHISAKLSPIALEANPILEALSKAKKEDSQLMEEFNALASKWYLETRRISSVEQIILHPAYQQIIGMGRNALPLIFRELKRSRGHWLWALAMILRDDKAQPGMNFRQAVDAWLEWGEKNGYI